jgi:lycopene cyclase domain-containing protein
VSTYLILNLFIIIIPLLFSFEKKIRFFKNIPFVILSILTVSPFYLIWDWAATFLGDWSFNKKYVGDIYILNLPVEEILFFITVPYACIFIYETVSFYLKKRSLEFKKETGLFIALLFVLNSFYFSDKNYTSVVLLVCALFFLLSSLFYPEILKSNFYWLTILISFIPFLAVNYLLTSLPVLNYNDSETWGIRISTIPIEDFFYSFSMISFWLMTYDFYKKKFTRII